MVACSSQISYRKLSIDKAHFKFARIDYGFPRKYLENCSKAMESDCHFRHVLIHKVSFFSLGKKPGMHVSISIRALLDLLINQ